MPIRTTIDLAFHCDDDSATLTVDRADWKGEDKRFISISLSARGNRSGLFFIDQCESDGSSMQRQTCNSFSTSVQTTTIAMKTAASTKSLSSVNAWIATEPDLDKIVTASEVFAML
jgi:hypothetical protein